MIEIVTIQDLFNQPRMGIYAFINDFTKVAYVCHVNQFLTWFSRNAIDIGNGSHKHNFESDNYRLVRLGLYLYPDNRNIRYLEYDKMCHTLENSGLTVHRNIPIRTFKVRPVLRRKDLFIEVSDSRGRVASRKQFKNIEDARKYVDNREILDILVDIETEGVGYV